MALPFAQYGLDKAGLRRADSDYMAALQAQAATRVFLLDGGRPVLAASQDVQRTLLYLPLATALPLLDASLPLIFMGLDEHGVAVFAGARAGNLVETDGDTLEGIGEVVEVRAAAMVHLSPPDIGLVGTARALLLWHQAHGFCSRCGHASEATDAGWKRQCPNCGAEHFPRTDPVAIMLPVLGDKCFLACHQGRPVPALTCLAGFVEPGESMAAACAREVAEESGLEVVKVTPIFDQPWPFPSQLMLGMLAEVANEQATLNLDEIAFGAWFTRDEVRAAMSTKGFEINGQWLKVPPPLAIAHWIIQYWLDLADSQTA